MNKKKIKKDYLVFTLCFQVLLCTVIFIGLFLMKDSDNKYMRVIENDFFDNIDDDFETVSEYKPDGIKPTDNIVQVDNTTIIDNKNNSTELLSAKVNSSGGKDTEIDSNNPIPDNVSVNGYTLNKNMFLPLRGEITSYFGERIHPISGEHSFHTGIDIAADTGTPIYSAFDGEVIVADYDQWNGYYLKITHDGEIMTVYCHCNTLFVEKGDLVKAGDKIAEVGSTGSSTGPHLHFEFRIDNVSYDPIIALNSATDEV